MMLYAHIPFCLSKCAYCDFNSYAGSEPLIPAYLEALQAEMDVAARRGIRGPLSSVYLGGGTPSLLSPACIGELLGEIEKRFGLQPGAEVTVEINPATWGAKEMCAAVERGVNRLSLGIQSLRDAELRTLGRPHDAAAAREALEDALGAGAASVSADLMYGLPGQDAAVWLEDLQEVMEMGVPHVSVYALNLEDGTSLAARVRRGIERLPEEEEIVRMYLGACELLEEWGYRHYEIANFALPGHACRHNRGYWDRRPYIGIGAGAHSFCGGVRWSAPEQLEEYISGMRGRRPDYRREVLDEAAVSCEELMLGLRTDRGVLQDALDMDSEGMRLWKREGLVSCAGARLRLTDRGMLLSNELISSLLP